MKNNLVIFWGAILFIMSIQAQAQEANYDESKVGAYILPDALITLEGQEVTTNKQWESRMRLTVITRYYSI